MLSAKCSIRLLVVKHRQYKIKSRSRRSCNFAPQRKKISRDRFGD